MDAAILAAGQSTRMRSKRNKVLHPLLGRPMISYLLSAIRSLAPERIFIVVGNQSDDVKSTLADEDIIFIEQSEQLGTGHAIQQLQTQFVGPGSALLIVNGDMPLLTPETLQGFLEAFVNGEAQAALLTANLGNPQGFGRIVRESDQSITRIVEEGEAGDEELSISEVNGGAYLFESNLLFSHLPRLSRNNDKKEYYLTDVVELLTKEGVSVLGVPCQAREELLGVNTRSDFARVMAILNRRICNRWMLEGVTILDPETTLIESQVSIGRDTVLYPGVQLLGKTSIGEDCVIRSYSAIEDSVIGDGVEIRHATVIEGSEVDSSARIGPFAHLRPGSVIRESAKIGNFVETKKAVVGSGTKAGHLSYLGDAEIGANVNIGAGTITCNYDGEEKHRTVVEDGAFTGSGTELVAPLTLKKGAYTGAGSTVTQDVPEDALAIARNRQRNILGWVRRRKKRIEKGKRGE